MLLTGRLTILQDRYLQTPPQVSLARDMTCCQHKLSSAKAASATDITAAPLLQAPLTIFWALQHCFKLGKAPKWETDTVTVHLPGRCSVEQTAQQVAWITYSTFSTGVVAALP